MLLGQKLYSSTHEHTPLKVRKVDFNFSASPSFIEKLLFLFGRKKIYVDNEMQYVNGVLHLKNHIKLLNLNA